MVKDCARCGHPHRWHVSCDALVPLANRPGFGRPCGCGIGKGDPEAREARRHIPISTRREVITRDGVKCAMCNVRVHSGANARRWPKRALHLDHIVAFSLGGSDDASNLRVLCASCNTRRGAAMEQEFT